MPIINNIQFIPNTVQPKTPGAKAKAVGGVFIAATAFFVGIFVATFPTSDNIVVALNASLLIALLILIPGTWLTLRDKPPYLQRFCEANQNRITPIRASASKQPGLVWDIVRDSIGQGDVLDMTEDFSGEQANGIKRSDGQAPFFKLGRLRAESSYGGYAFIVVDLPKKTPHIFIDYDKTATAMSSTSLRAKLGNQQRYDLEGEFGDLFTVYAISPNAMRYATYVMTPDVMAKIIDITPRADIEFYNGKLTILLRIDTKDWAVRLQTLFTILNTVADSLCKRTGAYIGDPGETDGQKLQLSAGGKVYYAAQGALSSSEAGEVVRTATSLAKSPGFWLTIITTLIVISVVVAIELSMGLGLD